MAGSPRGFSAVGQEDAGRECYAAVKSFGHSQPDIAKRYLADIDGGTYRLIEVGQYFGVKTRNRH